MGGITGPIVDIGTYAMDHTTETADNSTLQFLNDTRAGRIVFLYVFLLCA